jgi:RNA polymerase sigma factor (sigma-70 family)
VTDADLIARILASDDRHAFAELVRRHQSMVRNLLRRLIRDAGRADELAQDAFLLAYKNLRRYRGGARFSSWLYRIAYNLFLTEARRMTAPKIAAPEATSSAIESVERRHDLELALDDLRPEERAALVLTYARDVSHDEAAEILDIPLGTLKTHVARAKEKLRQRLAEPVRNP